MSDQTRVDIDAEVDWAAMTGVLDLRHVLMQVDDRINNFTFAEQDLID